MAEASAEELKRAVESQHGGQATFTQFVPVHEEQNGQTIWDGIVAIFELKNQPQAHYRAYAWSRQLGGGKRRLVAVLHSPKIKSPRDAVRAAVEAEQRSARVPRYPDR